ncbi:hypothetical protein FCM35_KLT10441 [Carex littledalei]|uniref:MATH domain-containing protein n=1 Tax=Carex littledalei TaxID=544730 RepID=A0A833QI05_9POAL|nr:hypothetical protein FCM35_KLT10441 [Carex littledalei]
MKSTASAKDVLVMDPIQTEKEVICDMETLSTVYRANIKGYSQFQFCPHDFTIDCGKFDLAGHRWSVYYYPNAFVLGRMVILHIRLLTYTTNSLKVDIQINLIAPNGRRLAVAERKHTYFSNNNVVVLPLIRKSILDSSEYVKEDCLSFECIMSTTKWAAPEEVKKKQQSAIPSSNSQ